MTSSNSGSTVVLIVTITLKADVKGACDTFVENFGELYRHVHANEPETLLYHLSASADRTKLIVSERYQNQAALDAHKASGPFQRFMAWANSPAAPIAGVAIEEAAGIEDGAGERLGLTLGRPQTGVLVFCGARPGAKAAYVAAGKSIGEAIAARKRTLVYGGGTVGVMGAVSTAVAAANGAIVGVIPSSLQPREVSGEMIGDIFFTPTMDTRKTVMFALSNTVVVLPGGIGTFDELLEVLTLLQLNAYRPKIGFLNVENYFGAFFAFLRHTIAEGFLEEHIFDFFVVEDSADGAKLLDRLDAFVIPPSPAQIAWSQAKPY